MNQTLEIDTLIRRGQHQEAKSLLEKERGNLSSLQCARFYRRLGQFDGGIRLLRPELFQEGELKNVIADPLRIEYANLLSFLGLTSEAKFHLSKVEKKLGYDYHFAQGIRLSTVGDFESARTSFEAASHSQHATEYEVLIALANLLNSHLGCFDYEATLTLDDHLKKSLEPKEHQNLVTWRSTCVAQAHAYLGHKNEFEEEMKTFLPNAKPENRLQLNQIRFYPFGRLLVGGLSSAKKRSHISELAHYKVLARQWHEWEAFRDLCIQEAFLTRNKNELMNAYFGSPSPFQKKRIRKWLKDLGTEAPGEPSLLTSKSIYYHETSLSSEASLQLNLNEGHGSLKFGKIPARMLGALLEDRYRPIRMHELHDKIWGDSQFFHPVHSPARVHQAINRLKHHLIIEKIPLKIKSNHDRYFMELGKNLEVNLNEPSVPLFLNRWRKQFRDSWVLSREAATRFDLHPRSIQLKLSEHKNHFEFMRQGTKRYYRLKL